MELHRQLAVGALDFDVGRGASNAQYLVVVAFSVGGQNDEAFLKTECRYFVLVPSSVSVLEHVS
jgi:hypothetical protein